VGKHNWPFFSPFFFFCRQWSSANRDITRHNILVEQLTVRPAMIRSVSSQAIALADL